MTDADSWLIVRNGLVVKNALQCVSGRPMRHCRVFSAGGIGGAGPEAVGKNANNGVHHPCGGTGRGFTPATPLVVFSPTFLQRLRQPGG
jgi:hypothetical protein